MELNIGWWTKVKFIGLTSNRKPMVVRMDKIDLVKEKPRDKNKDEYHEGAWLLIEGKFIAVDQTHQEVCELMGLKRAQ